MQSNTDLFSASCESDLRESVENSLQRTGYLQHRSLTISVDGAAVTVEGVLPTWFMRQVALECIKRVAGVVEVIDRIQVVRDAPHDPEPQFHPAFSKSATAQHMNEAEQIN